MLSGSHAHRVTRVPPLRSTNGRGRPSYADRGRETVQDEVTVVLLLRLGSLCAYALAAL